MNKGTIILLAFLLTLSILGACTDSKNGSGSSASDYLYQGIEYVEKGDLHGAINAFDQAIDLDLQNIEAYYQRGMACNKQENYDRALADLNQAITLDPDFALAYFNRGLSYSSSGNLDLAIPDFERALELGLNPAVAAEVEALLEELRGQG